MAENATKQSTLSHSGSEALAALASEEGKPVEEMLSELILTYKSERLKRPERAKALQMALEECWRISRQAGTDSMSMQEIDAEIAEARADTRRLARSA